MIEGYVGSNREATVGLELVDQTGQAVLVQAVIDTGFTEYLTLPSSLIEELSPPFMFEGSLILADDRVETFGIYDVTVTWNGATRAVLTHETGSKPLIGMAMLQDHSLHMDIIPGGIVTVEAIG